MAGDPTNDSEGKRERERERALFLEILEDPLLIKGGSGSAEGSAGFSVAENKSAMPQSFDEPLPKSNPF